jgi:hypothetical protein
MDGKGWDGEDGHRTRFKWRTAKQVPRSELLGLAEEAGGGKQQREAYREASEGCDDRERQE